MRRRRRSIIVFSMLLLLAASCVLATAHTRAPKERSESTVIFEVSRPDPRVHIITPIVIIAAGRYISPSENESEISKFVANYYRPDRRYRLLFGGGEAGTVTIEQPLTLQPGISEYAKVNSPVSLESNIRALATNAGALGRKQRSRRPPTANERTAVSELARKAYQQRGLLTSLLNRMETISLTASDLDRNGKVELIGSFEITTTDPDAKYTLFLIAEQHGNRYRAGVTWYHRGIDPEGFDWKQQLLVDHLDLDGDGIDEVIVIGEYYESWDYTIYKKQGGNWRSIYKGGGW